MNFTPLQTSEVTSGAKIIQAGPTYYWGFSVQMDIGRTDCVLVISDSSLSAVTVASSGSTATDIKTWMTILSGVSIDKSYAQQPYINGLFPYPVRCTRGLRGKLIGGHSGCTVLVHYGG